MCFTRKVIMGGEEEILRKQSSEVRRGVMENICHESGRGKKLGGKG